MLAQFEINKEETEFEARIPHSEIRNQIGDIAQLGERLLCTQEVRGSNPLISTIPPFQISNFRFQIEPH
jgi:hypothetical protein